jgi:hypothetical protein
MVCGVCGEGAPALELADEFALEDANDDGALGLLDVPAPLALLGPAEIAASVPHVARPPAEVLGPGDKRLKVNFDFWSHNSGLQRGYITCPYHEGDRCIKYSFVHLHADHDTCAAWLISWAANAHGKEWMDKPAHLKDMPLATEVARYKAIIS